MNAKERKARRNADREARCKHMIATLRLLGMPNRANELLARLKSGHRSGAAMRVLSEYTRQFPGGDCT
jgi:hypothetical protein